MLIPISWDAENTELWREVELEKQVEPSAWWSAFSDETLDQLLVDLENNNYSLEASYQRLLQAKAVLTTTRADLFPRLDSSGSYSRLKTSDNSVKQINDSYSFPFSLSWELDFWGKVRSQVESSKASFESSKADLADALLILQSELASNYFLLRTLDAEIAVVKKAINKRQENYQLVLKRHQTGFIGSIDVERAKTELASAEAELSSLERTRGLLKNAISVLVAKFPQEFEIKKQPLLSAQPEIPELIPSDLLERRPDVYSAEKRVIEANAQIGLAKSAFYPSFNLAALYGGSSSEFSEVFKARNSFWSIGPFFDLPIFTAGKNSANLRRSEARYLETVALYRETILQAIREVEDGLISLRTFKEQEAKQVQALSAAQQVAKMSVAQYQSGLGSFFEVVDAERELLEFERLLVQTRGARLIASVELVKALGGGWEQVLEENPKESSELAGAK